MPTLANWFHRDRFRTVPHFGLTCQCNFCKQPDRGLDHGLLGQGRISFIRSGVCVPNAQYGFLTGCLIIYGMRPSIPSSTLGCFRNGEMIWGREKDLWKGQPDHKAQDLTGAYEALRDLIDFSTFTSFPCPLTPLAPVLLAACHPLKPKHIPPSGPLFLPSSLPHSVWVLLQ